MSRQDDETQGAAAVFWDSADRAAPQMPDTPEAWAAYTQESVAYIRASIAGQFIGGISDRMRRMGITQSLLAKRMGVSEGRVSQLLSSDQNITLQTMAQLAAAVHGDIKITIQDRQPHPGTSRDPQVDLETRRLAGH